MTIEKPTFFAQLKQRHVFRVAAMYGVTAWLLLQIGGTTFEPLGFPGWSQRALIVVLAAGFPIALVLAWIFDVTPHGVVRSGAELTTGLSRGRKLDIVIIVVLLAALVVTFVWRREPTPGPTVAQDSSIAVLPFVAMSEDASLRHLGEGLSEQITNELAQRSELRVASRTSSFEQAGNAVAIAHALRMSYVLEGSVRPSGDKVRVTAQLVRGQDGLHVWSDTYNVVQADSTAWDQTASLIAATVSSCMIVLERDLQRARTFTANDEAYEHYAAARRLNWQLFTSGTATPKPFDQMLDEIDRAIALDPNFFSAHLVCANLISGVGREIACGSRCINEARLSIDRALALRPDAPDALLQLGFIQLLHELDPAAAEVTYERVRQIDPANRGLNEAFATLALSRGNAQEARDYWVRQLEISPNVAVGHVGYAFALVGIGDLEGAEREVKSALRLASRGETFGIAGIHIQFLIGLGKVDEAKAEFAPLWAMSRFTHPELFGRELASLGYEREARDLAAKLSQQSNVDPFWVFQAYYGLALYHDALMYHDALVWLRRVVDARDGRMLYILRVPNLFPGLWEQPGYAELLKYLDSIQRSR